MAVLESVQSGYAGDDVPTQTSGRPAGALLTTPLIRNGSGADAMFTVLIVHSDEIVRRGIETIVRDLSGVGNSYSCPDLTAAASLIAAQTRIDVVILADDLVGEDGSRAMMAARSGDAKVILMLGSLDRQRLAEAADLHPDGFLMENGLTRQTLTETLRQIHHGGMPMPAAIARGLLDEVQKSRRIEPQRPFLLTQREMQVLGLLVHGLSNKQIARKLGISINGAKRHVGNVLAKLNCPNRTLAAALAIRDRLI